MFSFRPHIQNLVFISKLLELENHDCIFLTCDSDVEMCYNLLLKNKNKVIDCPKCIIGGIRSYSDKVESLGKYVNEDRFIDVKSEWTQSSLATTYRVETPEQLFDKEIKKNEIKLKKSISKMCGAVEKWIDKNNIEAIICFNGRMDLTRGVIEICKLKKLPFLTYESSWFGHGINFVPNNSCLSSVEWLRLNEIYQKVPLTENQVKTAISIISQRFSRNSNLEWRQYNDSLLWNWANQSNNDLKILILPSSRNEFMGEEEYNNEWCKDSTIGFEKILGELKKLNQNLNIVLKAHPIWGQHVNGVLGDSIENHYKSWAIENKITWLGSSDKIDSHSLIKQSDILIINGSSAALEAGVIGKPIICISKMFYTDAGFTVDVFDARDLNKIPIYLNKFNKIEAIRKTLRFIYTSCRRFPQFVDGIVNKSILENDYFITEKTNGKRIIKLLETGKIEPFDDSYSENEYFENIYIGEILENNWNVNRDNNDSIENCKKVYTKIRIDRKGIFKIVNNIRNIIPKGDEL